MLRDAGHARQVALNNNTGTIHLSNLCTEITLPQDRDNISVCNLASINLSEHLVPQADGSLGFDWERMRTSVAYAVRQLDNLVDITLSSVSESERANQQNRAIGLGVMGFTDVTERLGYAYESAEAVDLLDEVVEFISFHAIGTSADLARERGSYATYAGSGWSQGLVPIDTIARVEADRGVPVQVDRTTRQDWDSMRIKVAGGMRNATLMAIAPTASIGLVAGTTPGLDPQFSQIFSRATSSGKFLEVNRNLVRDLQQLGLWEQVRDDLLATQGDLSRVPGVPEHLKAVYRTSFQLSPYAYVDVASRAQKWIDQAISRNIYLESRDISEMARLYAAAWEKGVKTTYYLHVKPRHTAEQSTVRVNKAETLPAGRGGATVRPAEPGAPSAPRRGFGFGKAAGTTTSDASTEATGSTATADTSATSATSATSVPDASIGMPAPTASGPTPQPAPAPAAGFASLTSHAAPPSVLAAVVDAARQTPARTSAPAPSPAAAAPRSGFGFGRVASAEPSTVQPSTVQPGSVQPSALQPVDLTPPPSATVLEVQEADIIDGVACPVDPMERLQCESCQ